MLRGRWLRAHVRVRHRERGSDLVCISERAASKCISLVGISSMSDEEIKQNLIHYVQRLNVSFSINF